MTASLAARLLLFTLVAPGVTAILVPALIRGDALLAEPIGFVLSAVGVAIYAWTAWNFANTGKGTPEPLDPPRTVVAVGLYRWVRNPMYIGVLATVLGQAIAFRSLALVAYAILVWLTVHAFVVGYEEPDLRRRFGESYESYRRSVPRWIPRPPMNGR